MEIMTRSVEIDRLGEASPTWKRTMLSPRFRQERSILVLTIFVNYEFSLQNWRFTTMTRRITLVVLKDDRNCMHMCVLRRLHFSSCKASQFFSAQHQASLRPTLSDPLKPK